MSPPGTWKAPLPEFIEHLYFKRFGRRRPEVVMSIEERHRDQQQKKEARRAAKAACRVEQTTAQGNEAWKLMAETNNRQQSTASLKGP